ncbi:MAG: pantoate--beta-alanine ligase [Acidobacteria bacterium]|nr:pantoate--beta-alanine ligase [Acidobacteriota bacterium]
MEIINRIPRMRSVTQKIRRDGRKIGFVPTMGALHEGHLSLIRRARAMSDIVVVSIFVNPIQFGRGEDFDAYPRDLARDAELVSTRGVDYLFAPNIDEVYPEDFSTYVIVEDLGDKLCGLSRPGHFRGVSTIVLKLFNVVRPQFSFFGQKDAQQAAILKRMVRDLCVDTEVVICPIVREPDGLAMSSRNAYLNTEERKAALVLSLALQQAKKLYQGGEQDAGKIISAMRQTIENEPFARIDYVSIVDNESLESLDIIDEKKAVLIALAVFINRVRLIDNITLNTSTQDEDDEPSSFF